MYTNVTPLTADKHGLLRYTPITDYRFAETTHAVRTLLSEMPRCACEYPIAFIQSSAKDSYLPVTLLSLTPKTNVYLYDSGLEQHWNAHYIPAAIRQYPFTVARGKESEDGTPFILCIDESSPQFSQQAGVPLFTSEGAPSSMLQKIQKALYETQVEEQQTHIFGKLLSRYDLLSPLNLDIPDAQPRPLSGLYAISVSRLEALAPKDYLALRNVMGAIYAHITSLGQVESLLHRSAAHRAKQTPEGPLH